MNEGFYQGVLVGITSMYAWMLVMPVLQTVFDKFREDIRNG